MKFKRHHPDFSHSTSAGRRSLISAASPRQDHLLAAWPTQRTLSTHPVPGHRCCRCSISGTPNGNPRSHTHHTPRSHPRPPASRNPAPWRTTPTPPRRETSPPGPQPRFELPEELDDDGVGFNARIRRRREAEAEEGGESEGGRWRSLVEVDDEGWHLARARIVH
ncbi:uncharacterized protein A4U43_C01F1800 [Asparagus officinalis]|uniref:Uncharacterized protein n=1 Tax=Asparagus officinalis TaxID=4686 RepID=A0A5P1FKZ2_ASPOF|nr:uncharacterized protein A4U43_C01F1800 [Asparagus officinalis]